MLSDIYEQNIEYFKKMFKHDSTFILREFKTARPNELKCAVMLFDGMVDGDHAQPQRDRTRHAGAGAF